MGEMFFMCWFHESKVALNSSRTRLVGRIEKVAIKGSDIISLFKGFPNLLKVVTFSKHLCLVKNYF